MLILYIDPGAGSMAIQALLAAALAIPFFFRSHASRLVGMFRRRRDRDETTSNE